MPLAARDPVLVQARETTESSRTRAMTRTAPGQQAKNRGKGILDSRGLKVGILTSATGQDGTTTLHGVATSVLQAVLQTGKADLADPHARKTTVIHALTLATAHPGVKAGRPADLADATADGVRNIPNCF